MTEQQFDTNKYIEQMALLLDLQLPDEYIHGVVANFDRIREIAQIVNEFPLPEQIEAAPTFEP
ncbi:MAG: DUF4089 domain-containing protein [Calothrix sp. MO_167.B42]|nr:DUF4089 domain-containing protein [Calothrix sp. MO_167.B42]